MRVRHGPAAVRGDASSPERHWPTGWEGGEGGSPESEDLPPASDVIPLVEGGTVVHRSIATLATLGALALAGCGGGDEADERAPAREEQAEQAAVLVTRDCGKEELVPKTEVPAGQTAMQALDRVADIEADSGGKFVTAIEGVEQDERKKLAWLFYMDGKMAEKGATEIRLEPGDVEWWDLHNWDKQCPVPPDAR